MREANSVARVRRMRTRPFDLVFSSTAIRAFFAVIFPVSALALSVTALGCSTKSDDTTNPGVDASVPNGDDTGDDTDASTGTPGDDAHVTGFTKKTIFFGGKDENRTADAPASFPATGSYSKITMHLALDCPSGLCDWWDRFGTIGIVQKGIGDGGSDVVIEIARFITPYRVAAKWDIDLTALRPLLKGDVTLRAFIDTWVGPGSANGNGWDLTTTFDMTGGIPDNEPVAVMPIWTRTSVVYGDPTKPIGTSAPAQTVDLSPLVSAGATRYALRSFITGHGQGNADNCAEFCSRKHTMTVQSKAHTATVWRTDCATTAVKNQAGTSTYSRAGWCPGATVNPWTIDASADIAGGTSATFAYDVESFVNTCRPQAALDDAGTCNGCTLGAGCAYDGSTHTEPSYFVSSLLIGYR